MSKGYTTAQVKYNNGNGALLCNNCSVIVDYGFLHEDRLHYCDECYANSHLIAYSQNMAYKFYQSGWNCKSHVFEYNNFNSGPDVDNYD